MKGNDRGANMCFPCRTQPAVHSHRSIDERIEDNSTC